MYNAEQHIVKVLEAIFGQDYSGEKEIIVVNDGSRDRSLSLVRPYAEERRITIIDQPNQGAVAATNNGFRRARFDFIFSIDSDVVLSPNWLTTVMGEFDDPKVAAVQGYYRTPKGVSVMARMMGYDVEARYDAIGSKYVTQVCTGDTGYRKAALDAVGLFDPQFVYGYDNDMSYRLVKAGCKLVFRKDAVCDHYWKADLLTYIRQQYRSAYGRMQLVRKHPERMAGDSVSGLRMILQVPFTLLAVLCLVVGALSAAIIGRSEFLVAGLICLGLMLIDRLVFSWRVLLKQKDAAVLLMPFVHLLRNAVWGWALVRWMGGLQWMK
jgi:cellulose synthase/poly-beta-1,6-N-acetylglucosamine synthase-like glycosyltransferase